MTSNIRKTPSMGGLFQLVLQMHELKKATHATDAKQFTDTVMFLGF